MYEIALDSLIAQHVAEAGDRFARGDADGCDRAYRKAIEQVARGSQLRGALQEDHLDCLMKLGRRALALERCVRYLDEHPLRLRVTHAEILSALGDHARAETVSRSLTAVRAELSDEQLARLDRVLGLALANDGRTETALDYLDRARRSAEALGWVTPLSSLLQDETRIILRREGYGGHETAMPDRRLETVPDHLHRAEELGDEARYEEALATLVPALSLPDFEPALHWPVLRAMTALARMLRLKDLAEHLAPLLLEAAVRAPDPEAASLEAVSMLTPGVADGASGTGRFDARITYVRRLLDDLRDEEAEDELVSLREMAVSPRDIALWHLAAAEAEWCRGTRSPGDPAPLRECAHHAALAVTGAEEYGSLETQIQALRIMGDALSGLDHPDSDSSAVECWARAHKLAETIASRQRTDEGRIKQLHAEPDEHDKRIRSATERAYWPESSPAAAIAVAVEAARGGMILSQILPADIPHIRALPPPSDWTGARRWVSATAAHLPSDQAAWMIHATPDKVHHVVVHRGRLLHAHISRDRHDLYEAIGTLAICWNDKETLEECVASGEFERNLAEVARLLGIDEVCERLPARVRRLAVIAGGDVTNVPFAGLPLPENGGPLGLRYALSDLPCLSALAPLRQRACHQRGDTALLVQPDDDLTRACVRARDTLAGPNATTDNLRDSLATRRHQIVRFDGHGVHDHDEAGLSTIRLSSPDTKGQLLRAHQLQHMDLAACGTFVLGACESGMVQRLGHDEWQGFVRAAFNAGAASVVAARWAAPDAPAASLLDRFQRHLRHMPRDLALRAAMRDVCAKDFDLPHPRNPARWACWSLYGDSALQTKAGPLRRWLRGLTDRPGREP